MLPKRTLALRAERLAELEPADLRGVAGGTHINTDCYCSHHTGCWTCACRTFDLYACIKEWFHSEAQAGPGA